MMTTTAPPYVRVHLEEYEVRLALYVASRRQEEAAGAGRSDRHGFAGDGLAIHLLGTAGEMAAAKALNCYWGGAEGTFKRPDLGGIQVRTRSRHDYDLIVRPGDADDEPFLLVTGTMPAFRVHGWLWGREAKQPQWLQTHGGREPAYFVPQAALRPLTALPGGPR